MCALPVLAGWLAIAGVAHAQDPGGKTTPPSTAPDKDGSAAGPAAQRPGSFLVGDQAPDINLRDSKGVQFQLSKACKERPWLVVFARVPGDGVELEGAEKDLTKLGIGSVLVAPFQHDRLVTAVPKPHFRLLPDRASYVARTYGQYDAVTSTPRIGVVLVDRRGRILLTISGGIPSSDELVRLAREALEAADATAPVGAIRVE